jgi:hypothetical protein
MSVRVFYDILNQKGTPAMYTDTLANRPTFGFAGRLFISTDSGQIFEDTGSAWTLVADAGVGGGTLSSVCLNGNTTATGIVITAGGLSTNNLQFNSWPQGSIMFVTGANSNVQGNPNLTWDNTYSYLGLGTLTPGARLDIHGTGTQIQINGTGSSNSYIQFQNAGVNKWRIGNTYSAGANSYGIYNNGLSSLALTINSTNNGMIATGYLNIENALGSNQIYLAKLSSDTYGTIQTEIGGGKYSLGNVSNIGTLGTAVITWTSGLQVGINNISPTYDFDVTGTGRFTGILRLGSTLSNGTYFYTLPSATGTLALTSNLSSYLPLTGGTLTGQLYINPTNTGTTGLDVASDNISFRSDNLEGFKRQLLITMGSGTLIQLRAAGYGGTYVTDMDFVTSSSSGVNSTPAIYLTGSGNNVGINTGTPTTKLEVYTGGYDGIKINASDVPSLFFYVQGGAQKNWGIATTNLALGDFGIYQANSNGGNPITAGTSRIYITGGGNVGISNNGSSSVRLQVSGVDSTSSNIALAIKDSATNDLFYVRNDGLIATGVQPGSPYNNTTANLVNMRVDAGGILLRSTASSQRFKQEIKDWNESGLNTILALKPKTFKYKKDYYDKADVDFLGLIAEEVAEVSSYLAEYENEDRTGQVENVKYATIVVPLIKAIQEINEKLVKNNIN